MNEKSCRQLVGDGPEAYEKYIVPAFSSAWAQDMVNRASLRSGDRVLDIGCGTGIVSRYAFKTLGDTGLITGMDINENVLRKASEIWPPDITPIEWKQGDVSALPFSDAMFDNRVCNIFQIVLLHSQDCRANRKVGRIKSCLTSALRRTFATLPLRKAPSGMSS